MACVRSFPNESRAAIGSRLKPSPQIYPGRTKAVPFDRRRPGEPRFPPAVSSVRLMDGRVVRMETVGCRLCEETGSEPILAVRDWRYGLTEARFRIVRCRRCGLAYLNPRPVPDDIGLFYPIKYYERRVDGSDASGGDPIPPGPAAAGLRPDAMRERRALCGTGERVLDVGCADGGFLQYMSEDGWEVLGVEVSPEAAAWGGADRGVTIINSPLTEADLPREHFDVVTFWASLEHVHEPLAYLEVARRVLRRGGRAIILLQNFASPTVRRLHWGLDPPRHLYHFTPSTLTQALRRTGFHGNIRFRARTRIHDGSFHGQVAKIGRRLYREARRGQGGAVPVPAAWALARLSGLAAPVSWTLTALGLNGAMIAVASRD